MILDAVRESRGLALAADEDGIRGWMRLACRAEGLSLCPEAAVAIGVLEGALAEGSIRPDETVVLYNTGAAQKYVEALAGELPRLEKASVRWEAIADASERRNPG
jgi:threonine synthase